MIFGTPITPPAMAPTSYAANVLNSQQPTPHANASSIAIKENDISLTRHNGHAYLYTSDEFHVRISLPLRKVLIVKLMGKTMDIQYMYDRLKSLWTP